MRLAGDWHVMLQTSAVVISATQDISRECSWSQSRGKKPTGARLLEGAHQSKASHASVQSQLFLAYLHFPNIALLFALNQPLEESALLFSPAASQSYVNHLCLPWCRYDIVAFDHTHGC